MKRIIYIASVVLSALLWTSCNDKLEQIQEDYFEVSPSSIENQSALGEGDAIVISIKTNLAWTISTEYSGADKDWIIFEKTEGEGDADVFGIILRGNQGSNRNCTITVATKNGAKSVDLKVEQGKFVPKIIELSLSDVISTGSADGPKPLLDYSQIDVTIVTPAGAENCLAEDDCVIITDGNNFAKARIPDAKTLKAGDKVKLDLTEGTVTKESAGGTFIDVKQKPISKTEGVLDIKPSYIASTSVSGYAYALVKVGGCQAPDAKVGKTWGSGTVTMDMVENEVGTVDVLVDSKASFASEVIPGTCGTVTGIVVDGKVRPRSAADLGELTNARSKKYEVSDFRIKSIVNMFKYGGVNLMFDNLDQEGTNKVNFKDVAGWSHAGSSISMNTSTKIAYVAAAATPFQSCFTTIGWEVGNSYWLFEVTLEEKTWGDLEFGVSFSHGTAGNLPWEYEVTWSSDGTNFKPVDELYCHASNEIVRGNVINQKVTAHADSRYCAVFNIPEANALGSGDKLYLKCALVKATKCTTALTDRMNCGFYLASASKNDPAPQYDNILAAENFDNCRFGVSPVVGFPLDYLMAWSTVGNYPARNGWTVSGAKGSMRCILLYQDGAAVYSPKLSKLTSNSDVTVTFKACLFTSQTRDNSLASSDKRNKTENIKVTTTGGGTVGDIEWDTDPETDYYSWHTATVRIKNATPETSVAINGSATNGSFFVKDIMITK